MIINITGGPDLSLMEVSAASSIVQEAADEDANIIFGAVVDPSLTGKVKITVIATGFSPLDAMRSGAISPTPVDLSPYSDQARQRADAAQAAAAAERTAHASRLTIARRGLSDLPLAVGGSTPGASGGAGSIGGPDEDLEGGANFDVPAFLRRQEG